MSKKSNVQKIQNLTKRVNNISRRLNSNAPVAISYKNGNRGKDFYTTSGCERISDVTVIGTSFNCVDLFINPANPSLFPWLSGIASKYDLYHFKKLIFRYKPSLPTSEAGNVYLGIDYNTLDPTPPSSIDLCQLTHWTTNVVWKPNSLSIDLKDSGWLYTRSGPVPNADYKTYDLGRFFLATENISYSSTVGYVEVEYQIEFKRRQPDYVSTLPSNSDTPIVGYNSIAASTVAANADLSIPTPGFDTSNGIITVSSSAISVSEAGLYQISIACATSGGYLRIYKDGVACATFPESGTIVMKITPGDVIKIHNPSSTTVDVYSYCLVKLN